MQALGGEEESQHVIDVRRQAGVIERGRKGCHLLVVAAAVAHVHADDVASGAPQLVGVAQDVLGMRGTLKPMEQDRRWLRRAYCGRLPVALAEDLAGDLASVRWRHLYELVYRRREMMAARKGVAEDGLRVAVGDAQPGMKRSISVGPWCRGACGLGTSSHSRTPASSLPAAWSSATALSAPVGSSSCLK